jgi:hypothetical protein
VFSQFQRSCEFIEEWNRGTDDLLAHVAPLGWEHIALTGDYVWTDSSAITGFRPIRDIPAAFLPRAA